MGERAYILMQQPNGSVKGIYSQWGANSCDEEYLLKNYRTRKDVNKLLNGGDISSMYQNGETRPLGGRNDNTFTTWENMQEFVDDFNHSIMLQSIYLFNDETNPAKWIKVSAQKPEKLLKYALANNDNLNNDIFLVRPLFYSTPDGSGIRNDIDSFLESPSESIFFETQVFSSIDDAIKACDLSDSDSLLSEVFEYSSKMEKPNENNTLNANDTLSKEQFLNAFISAVDNINGLATENSECIESNEIDATINDLYKNDNLATATDLYSAIDKALKVNPDLVDEAVATTFNQAFSTGLNNQYKYFEINDRLNIINLPETSVGNITTVGTIGNIVANLEQEKSYER